MAKYIKVTPGGDIILHTDPTEGAQTGFIILENVTEDKVAFRIRSSKRDFIFTPANGVLEPRENKKVEIRFHNPSPGQSGEEIVEVLAFPLDEHYLADYNIRALYDRSKGSHQNHQLYVKYHSEDKGHPGSFVSPSVKHGTPHGQSGQERKGYEIGPIEDEATLTQFFRQAEQVHPASAAFNRKSVGHHSQRQEERPMAGGHHHLPNREERAIARGSNEKVPHYDLPLQSRDEEPEEYMVPLQAGEGSSESRFAFGRSLMQKFSKLGEKVRDLAREANNLQHSQRFTMIIFWVVLTLLFILVFFLVVIPVWRHYSGTLSPHRSSSMADSLGSAATEIGDLIAKDSKGMTLDEYIHSRMR